MLVLSRKKGEQIVIDTGNHQIVVEVTDIVGGRVRLGVQAPRDIGVHRREVFERMVQWHGEELSNGR